MDGYIDIQTTKWVYEYGWIRRRNSLEARRTRYLPTE